MKILKYELFKDETINFITSYKEDSLCNFINKHNLEQKDIQLIISDETYLKLFYWEDTNYENTRQK